MTYIDILFRILNIHKDEEPVLLLILCQAVYYYYMFPFLFDTERRIQEGGIILI
jgi:hypothetical protein